MNSLIAIHLDSNILPKSIVHNINIRGTKNNKT